MAEQLSDAPSPPLRRKRLRDTDQTTRDLENLQKRLRRASGDLTLEQLLYKAGVAALSSEGPEPENDSWDKSLPGGVGVAKKHASSICRLLALADGQKDMDIAVSWVLGQGRPERCRAGGFDMWDPETRRYMAAGVQSVYFRTPLGCIAGSLDGAYNDLYTACKYIMEWHLFHWLVGQNCDTGVAPGSFDMFAAAIRSIPAKAPQEVQDALRGHLSEGDRTAYAWLASFRKRWGGTKGKLPTGEDEAPPEAAGKDP